MEAGAVGLNTGLDYQPGANSDTEELLELCRVVRDEYDGMYASHMRYSGAGLAGAVREIMRLTRETGIPVSIAHYNNDGESAALLEEADREGGLDYSFESYMYPAGSTHFLMSLPLEDQVGGPDALQERMQDPAYRDRLLGHVNLNLDRPTTERARAYFSDTRTGRFIGQTIPEAADANGITVPEFVRLLVDEELPEALLVYHRGFTDEEFAPTVRATIQHPRMMVASDGIAHAALPHPRGAGCFARVLRYQVRELGAVSLEEAIRKMTGFVAERYGLTDIGRLETGRRADVVVFDPVTAGDRATWDEPRLEPVGIDAVLVNGVTVVERGDVDGRAAGRGAPEALIVDTDGSLASLVRRVRGDRPGWRWWSSRSPSSLWSSSCSSWCRQSRSAGWPVRSNHESRRRFPTTRSSSRTSGRSPSASSHRASGRAVEMAPWC